MGKKNPQAAAAMKLMTSEGITLKEAWARVKGKAKAKAKPRKKAKAKPRKKAKAKPRKKAKAKPRKKARSRKSSSSGSFGLPSLL